MRGKANKRRKTRLENFTKTRFRMGSENFDAVSVDDVFDHFTQEIAFESKHMPQVDRTLCDNSMKEEIEVVTGFALLN